jgi:hypothetical protein
MLSNRLMIMKEECNKRLSNRKKMVTILGLYRVVKIPASLVILHFF